MSKTIWIKVFNITAALFLIFLAGCDFFRNGGKTEMASVSAEPCDENAMRGAVKTLLQKWGDYPSYVARTIAHSAYDCFGPLGFDIELKKITGELMHAENGNAKKKFRDIASETPAESYKRWASVHGDIEGLANTTRWAGYMGKAGIFEPVVSTGLITAAAVLDQANKVVDVVATSYARQIIKRGFDQRALQKARSQGRTPEERQFLLTVEMKKEASSFSDASQFLDHDAISALDAGLDNAIKYESYLEGRVDRNSADIGSLKRGYHDLKERQKGAIKVFTQGMKSLGDHMGGLADTLSRVTSRQGAQLNFLIALQEDKMSAEDKIHAINDLGYGTFKDDSDKTRTLDILNRMKKFEDADKWISKNLQPLQHVDQILNNVGIHSQELGQVVTAGWKVQAVSRGLTQLAGGDVLGGLGTVTNIFAGSQDIDGARHAEIMAALNQIIELQRQTIELQIQTMKMVEALSKQIEAGFKSIHQELGYVMQMQQMAWNVTFNSQLQDKLSSCDAIDANIRTKMIELSGGDADRLEATTSSGGNFLDKMAGRPFPLQTVAQMRELAEISARWRPQPNECFTSVRRLTDSLIFNFERHLLGDDINQLFVQTGHDLTKNSDSPSETVKDSGISSHMINALKSLSLFTSNSGLAPQVTIAAMGPTSTYRDFHEMVSRLENANIKNLPFAQNALVSQMGTRLLSETTAQMRTHLLSTTTAADIYDPVLVGQLVQKYLNLLPLSYFLGSEGDQQNRLLPYNELDPNETIKIQSLIRLVEFVIAQQALLSGQPFLSQLSGAIGNVPYFDITNNPGNGGGTAAVKQEVLDLLEHSGPMLYNLMRYRLSLAFRDRPAPIYAALYKQTLSTRDTFLFNSAIANEGLAVVFDDYGKPIVVFNLKVFSKTPLKNFNIELPSPEEFDDLQIAFTSNVAALFQLRDRLLHELYYHSLGPGKDGSALKINRVAKAFKEMAL